MPHGLGKLTFGDGCTYSGSFVDGAPHGKGKYFGVEYLPNTRPRSSNNTLKLRMRP
jgi:hypothetical protein